MRYRIDQDQLWEFLARQARLVERLPVEAAEAAADGYSDASRDKPEYNRALAMIVARDGGVSWLCGGPGATSADHVVALADGGSNFPTNLGAVHPHRYARNARRSSALRDRPTQRLQQREWPGAIDLRALR
jgi:hypothetical protein